MSLSNPQVPTPSAPAGCPPDWSDPARAAAFQAWLARVDADERLAWRRAHFVMACTAADIDAVMFEVVQGVGGERFHGERRAVAAQSATVPLIALYRTVGEREFRCSGAYFVGHHGRILYAVPVIDGGGVLIPVLERRTVGAGLVVGLAVEPGDILAAVGDVGGAALCGAARCGRGGAAAHRRSQFKTTPGEVPP